MQKIGEFWVPEIDVAPGENVQKSRNGFENRSGVQIAHLKRALELLPGRSVAVDGGANVGAWTKLMAEHFQKVHSFEPNPEVFLCLARNVTEWGAQDIAAVYPKGLSDRAEFVSIGTKKGARTVTGKVVGPGGIECVTIDSLNLSECALLKFDLEGYEDRALRGAANTILRCRPWVLIENKQRLLDKLFGGTRAHRFLVRNGYTLVEKIGAEQIDWLFKPRS